MFKNIEKNNPGFEGGIVRDPMFVVCCVINNNTFELWSDLTIKHGIAGGFRRGGGREGEPAATANQTCFYMGNKFWGSQACEGGRKYHLDMLCGTNESSLDLGIFIEAKCKRAAAG